MMLLRCLMNFCVYPQDVKQQNLDLSLMYISGINVVTPVSHCGCTQKTEILHSCDNLIFMLPMGITIVKEVMICSLEICSFHLQGNSTSNLINNTNFPEQHTFPLFRVENLWKWTFKKETACSSESMVIIYHSTCHHIHKDNNLNYHTPPEYAVA
jgi:hypothetical protein